MKCTKFISNVLKPFSCGMLIGCLCLTSTPIYSNASATTEGNKKYVTVNNVQFEMYNGLYTGKLNNKQYACAYTVVSAEQKLQDGFLGGKAVLYHSSGTVAAFGNEEYSSGYSSILTATTSRNDFGGSPVVYSHGYAYIWNGRNDYITYQPNKTANLNNYT